MGCINIHRFTLRARRRNRNQFLHISCVQAVEVRNILCCKWEEKDSLVQNRDLEMLGLGEGATNAIEGECPLCCDDDSTLFTHS
jgi:hypothetical protein